jgi:hypothetical protein
MGLEVLTATLPKRRKISTTTTNRHFLESIYGYLDHSVTHEVVMTADFYPENGRTKFLRNVGKYLVGYTATIPEDRGKR